MKPICIKCARFYRPKRNGIYFREGMPTTGAPPGIENDHLWTDYKIWCGDLWECRGCGHQLLTGFGSRAIAEHHQEGFAELVTRFEATFRVNDC